MEIGDTEAAERPGEMGEGGAWRQDQSRSCIGCSGQS